MPKLNLEIGEEKLVFDTDKITLRKVKELAESVSDVKAKYSPFTKYPMNDGESLKDYQNRVVEEILERNDRNEFESTTDYIKRLYAPEMDSQSMVFDTLRAIAKLVEQENKITDESYDKVPYVACKKFISDILTTFDLE